MSVQHSHSNFPKLHNAMWPGLVGKGSPGAEPCIELDTMLDLTTKAEVNGVKFFPTFHPAYVLRNMGELGLFEADLRTACRDAGLIGS